MTVTTFQSALRPAGGLLGSTMTPGLRLTTQFLATSIEKRSLSSHALRLSITSTTHHHPPSARHSLRLAATPPSPTSTTASSFFTPSLCRKRHASTTSTIQTPSDPTPATTTGTSNPPASSVVLDWNTFFRLRKSRRRYSLASSVISSTATTFGAFVTLASQPELGDQIAKIIPVDPVFGMGIATVAATLLGWLIGPVFGNTVWRLFHRAKLPEFTIKERAFFDRIKRHRVNPAGASTNNPVPDYYGEKVSSVQGYRRWLKDQRVFNRKREGTFVK